MPASHVRSRLLPLAVLSLAISLVTGEAVPAARPARAKRPSRPTLAEVIGIAGRPGLDLRGVTVLVRRDEPNGARYMAVIGKDNEFRFHRLPPGSYEAKATHPYPGGGGGMLLSATWQLRPGLNRVSLQPTVMFDSFRLDTTVTVPDVRGMAEADARWLLASHGLRVTKKERAWSASVRKGRVAGARQAGTTPATMLNITLSISLGPRPGKAQPKKPAGHAVGNRTPATTGLAPAGPTPADARGDGIE